MKKSAIIYVSVHHKNTKKIVECIANELNADVFDLNDAKEMNVDEYDVIGFGSGVYFSNINKSLDYFIDEFKSVPKDTFIILTSGTKSNKYENILSEKLTQKGFHVLGSFHCKGYDTNGIWKYIGGIAKNHPNKKDIKNAINFARELKKYIIKSE